MQEATTTDQMYVITFWGHAAPGVSPKLPGIEQILEAGSVTWPGACPGASARKTSLGGGLNVLRAHTEHAAVQTAAGCTRDSPSLPPKAYLSPTCTFYHSCPPEPCFWPNYKSGVWMWALAVMCATPLLVPSAWVNGGTRPRVPFLPLSACCKEVNCHPFFSLFWIKGCIDRSRTPPFFIVFLQIWYQWQATAGSNINRIWSIINRSGVSFRNSQKCFLPHFAKLCLLFLSYFSIPVTVLSSL